MYRMKSLFTAASLVAVAMFAMTGVAQADTMHGPFVADNADIRLNDTNGDGVGDSTGGGGPGHRVGSFGLGDARGIGMPFKLPTMGAGEAIVTDATLTFSIFSEKDATEAEETTADLYVSRVDPSSTVLAGDFDTTGTHTLIESAVIKYDETNGNETITVGSAAMQPLVDWLNTGNRYQAGEFVFLSIVPDAAGTVDDNAGWDVASSDHPDTSKHPTLSLTTDIPEPASLALFGIGGLVMLARRKRA